MGWRLYIILLGAIFINLAYVQAACTGTDYVAGNDWDIVDTTVCSDMEIHISDDKDITVYGNLTLDNVNLTMNPATADGSANFSVNGSGNLSIITSGANKVNNITSNTSNEFGFWAAANSYLYINNLNISEVGWDHNDGRDSGIHIESLGAKIYNTYIDKCNVGIIINNSAQHSFLENITIQNTARYSLIPDWAVNLTVKNFKADSTNARGIYAFDKDGHYEDVFVHTTTNSPYAAALWRYQWGNNTYINTTLIADGSAALMTYQSGYSGGDVFINSNLSSGDASDYTINMSKGTSARTIYFLNSTFNRSDVYIRNTTILDVQWYLNVHVNNTAGKNVSSATVLVYNTSNSIMTSTTTNESGMTARLNITEYIETNSGKAYQTNLSINTTHSHSLYTNGSTMVNLTDSNTTHVEMTVVLINLIQNISSNLRMYDDPITINSTHGTYGSTLRFWLVFNDSDDEIRRNNCTLETTAGNVTMQKHGRGSFISYFNRHDLGSATKVNVTAINCSTLSQDISLALNLSETYMTYTTNLSAEEKPVALIRQATSGTYDTYFDTLNGTIMTYYDIDFKVIDGTKDNFTNISYYNTIILPSVENYSDFNATQRTNLENAVKVNGSDVYFNYAALINESSLSDLCGLNGTTEPEHNATRYNVTMDSKFINHGEWGEINATDPKVMYTVNTSRNASSLVKTTLNQTYDVITMNHYGNGTFFCSGIKGQSSEISINMREPNSKAIYSFFDYSFRKHYGKSATFTPPLWFAYIIDDPAEDSSFNSTLRNHSEWVFENYGFKTTMGVIGETWNASVRNSTDGLVIWLNNSDNASFLPHGWYQGNIGLPPGANATENCSGTNCPCNPSARGEFFGKITGTDQHCEWIDSLLIPPINNFINTMQTFQGLDRNWRFYVAQGNLASNNASRLMKGRGMLGGYALSHQLRNGSHNGTVGDLAFISTNNITGGYSAYNWLTRVNETDYFALSYRIPIKSTWLQDTSRRDLNTLILQGVIPTLYAHREMYFNLSNVVVVKLNQTQHLLNRTTSEDVCHMFAYELMDYGISARTARLGYNCDNYSQINVTGRNPELQHTRYFIPQKEGYRWYAYSDTYANHSNITDNHPTTIYGGGTFTFEFFDNETSMYDILHVNGVDNGMNVENVSLNTANDTLTVIVTGEGTNRSIRFRVPPGTYDDDGWEITKDGTSVATGTRVGEVNYTITTMSTHTLVFGPKSTTSAVAPDSSTGGGSTTTTISDDCGESCSIDETTMTVGDKINFTLKDKEYILRIENINEEEETVKIKIKADEDIILTIASGEAKNIDVDGDGKEDITVTLKKLDKYGRAVITLESITEAPQLSPETEEETILEEIKENLPAWIFVGLGIIILAVIIRIAILRHYKSNHFKRARKFKRSKVKIRKRR